MFIRLATEADLPALARLYGQTVLAHGPAAEIVNAMLVHAGILA